MAFGHFRLPKNSRDIQFASDTSFSHTYLRPCADRNDQALTHENVEFDRKI